MHLVAFWYRYISEQLQNLLTYAMWKYIIIGSVVLLAGTSFLFHKNNSAMSAPDGEVAEIQKRFESAVKKSNDIELDQAIKKYAEIRTAYFKQEMEKFAAEKAEWEEKDAPLDAEISKAKANLEQAEKDFQNYQSDFNAFKKDAVAAVENGGAEPAEEESGEEELVEGGVALGEEEEEYAEEETESSDEAMDSSGEDEALAAVGQKIADLMRTNEGLTAKHAAAELHAKNLEDELARTKDAIAKEEQLQKDRVARISPVDLSCSVLRADSQWDYVVLDAGVNKGIVIGSRLAVTRGDKKVCELMVTLVEPTRASCDVIYSTIRPGDAVQPGDRVTSVRNN